MTKITVDKALIEQAAESLERIDAWFKARHFVGLVPHEVSTVEALRAALAEPAVEPVGEVNRYGLDSHGRMWHGIHWYDPNVDTPTGTKLYTAPPPPAEVPLLTSGEMEAAWLEARGTLRGYGPFARAIEQAVRQKAGLK